MADIQALRYASALLFLLEVVSMQSIVQKCWKVLILYCYKEGIGFMVQPANDRL